MKLLSYFSDAEIDEYKGDKGKVETMIIRTDKPNMKIIRMFTGLRCLECVEAVCTLAYIRQLEVNLNKQTMADDVSCVIRDTPPIGKFNHSVRIVALWSWFGIDL